MGPVLNVFQYWHHGDEQKEISPPRFRHDSSLNNQNSAEETQTRTPQNVHHTSPNAYNCSVQIGRVGRAKWKFVWEKLSVFFTSYFDRTSMSWFSSLVGRNAPETTNFSATIPWKTTTVLGWNNNDYLHYCLWKKEPTIGEGRYDGNTHWNEEEWFWACAFTNYEKNRERSSQIRELTNSIV